MRVQFVFLYSVPLALFFISSEKGRIVGERIWLKVDEIGTQKGRAIFCVIVIGNCGLIYRAYKNYTSLGKFIELGVRITISRNRVEQHKLTEREITNEMLD